MAQGKVEPGTKVFMRANTWGFPDTKTSLGVLKDREAKFQIWESDTGRHPLFGWGDDEVFVGRAARARPGLTFRVVPESR